MKRNLTKEDERALRLLWDSLSDEFLDAYVEVVRDHAVTYQMLAGTPKGFPDVMHFARTVSEAAFLELLQDKWIRLSPKAKASEDVRAEREVRRQNAEARVQGSQVLRGGGDAPGQYI